MTLSAMSLGSLPNWFLVGFGHWGGTSRDQGRGEKGGISPLLPRALGADCAAAVPRICSSPSSAAWALQGPFPSLLLPSCCWIQGVARALVDFLNTFLALSHWRFLLTQGNEVLFAVETDTRLMILVNDRQGSRLKCSRI